MKQPWKAPVTIQCVTFSILFVLTLRLQMVSFPAPSHLPFELKHFSNSGTGPLVQTAPEIFFPFDDTGDDEISVSDLGSEYKPAGYASVSKASFSTLMGLFQEFKQHMCGHAFALRVCDEQEITDQEMYDYAEDCIHVDYGQLVIRHRVHGIPEVLGLGNEEETKWHSEQRRKGKGHTYESTENYCINSASGELVVQQNVNVQAPLPASLAPGTAEPPLPDTLPPSTTIVSSTRLAVETPLSLPSTTAADVPTRRAVETPLSLPSTTAPVTLPPSTIVPTRIAVETPPPPLLLPEMPVILPSTAATSIIVPTRIAVETPPPPLLLPETPVILPSTAATSTRRTTWFKEWRLLSRVLPTRPAVSSEHSTLVTPLLFPHSAPEIVSTSSSDLSTGHTTLEMPLLVPPSAPEIVSTSSSDLSTGHTTLEMPLLVPPSAPEIVSASSSDLSTGHTTLEMPLLNPHSTASPPPSNSRSVSTDDDHMLSPPASHPILEFGAHVADLLGPFIGLFFMIYGMMSVTPPDIRYELRFLPIALGVLVGVLIIIFLAHVVYETARSASPTRMTWWQIAGLVLIVIVFLLIWCGAMIGILVMSAHIPPPPPPPAHLSSFI